MSNLILIDEVRERPAHSVAPGSPAEKIILCGVWWETYEQLLANFDERSSPHFAYDEGSLEIMILSARHEVPNRTLALLIDVLAEEFGINVKGFGSTTFKRSDLKKGFEPDSCFYVQNEKLIRNKEEIDLAVDPPPDLVIEIDMTSPSLNKFPIYAAVGVPEIWRYKDYNVTLYKLADDTYTETAESLALPRVTGQIVTQFLAEGRTLERLEWLRRVRAWARQA